MSSEVNGTLPIITAGSGGPRPGAAGATAPGVGPKRRGATVYRHKQYMLQCIDMDRAYFVSGLARFLGSPLPAGNPYLSRSTTSHWYFNPDIPEAKEYYDRFTLYNR
jgi:hypothetical protein